MLSDIADQYEYDMFPSSRIARKHSAESALDHENIGYRRNLQLKLALSIFATNLPSLSA